MRPITRDLMSLYRHLGHVERDAICCGDVTVQQCAALQLLLRERVDVSTFAGSLGITVSAATRLTDGLKRRGWVTRERDPEDRRRVVLQLSEEGEAEAKRLEAMTDAMIATLMERIPEAKRAQVLESVRLVLDALDGLGGLRCCE